MPEKAGPAGGQHDGLLDSMLLPARSLLALAQTRLEILSSEIEEQRTILVREALFAVIAAFFFGLAIVFTAIFFVVLLWETHRLFVLGFMAALFFLGAGFACILLREAGRDRPKPFSTTMSELAKDRESLQ